MRPVSHLSRFLLVSLIVLSALASSCSDPTSPEQIVLEFIDRAESAIENRSVRGLKKLVSKNYSDPLNRTHHDVLGLGSAYLLRTGSIHVFTDLASAAWAEDRIEARILAAFVAGAITDREMLLQMDGDIYWFNIVLKDEGDGWQVISATWQQAMLDDFIGK